MDEEQKFQSFEENKMMHSSVLIDKQNYCKSLQEFSFKIREIKVSDFEDIYNQYKEFKEYPCYTNDAAELKDKFTKKIPVLDKSKSQSIKELLNKINDKYEDPKYTLEDWTDSQSEKNLDAINSVIIQQRMIAKRYEAIKNAQKEKFQKQQKDDIKQELINLDELVDDNFIYNFQYRQGDRTKEIQIKQCDLLKLNLPNYLNDAIINFYLKILENLLIPEELRLEIYTFNTYFMEKLCPNEKLSQIQSSDKDKLSEFFRINYEQIKRWVKEDLFLKKYLLFPLNLPEHWSLIIVCNPIAIFDENKKSEAYILYMDSFGIIDQRIISIVRMYLHKNYIERFQNHPPYSESPISKIPAYQPLVPRQVNYIDCGVFLLQYAESFLMNPTYFIQDKDNQYNLDRLKWFPRALVNRKRYQIKKLIIELKTKTIDDAVQCYLTERQEIIDENNDENQYDVIDHECFEEFLKLKGVINLNKEQRHQQMLDFYMNPNYNYYHAEEFQMK